jgi:hypothetical protein
MSRFFPRLPRLVSVYVLLIVYGLGCTDGSPQEAAEQEPSGSPASDSSTKVPNPLAGSTIPEPVQDSAPATADVSTLSSDCRAQGIDDEEDFARKVCVAASDLGFRTELVHSYGAGGVDVFITEADAELLARNRAELERMTVALTEWTKANYHDFNAVDVTIVGESKIARGRKLGSRATTIELFP